MTVRPSPPNRPVATAQVAGDGVASSERRAGRGAEEARPQTRIERQREQILDKMREELRRACDRDRGTKCNAQGYKVSWNGYKLPLDSADCGVPVSALLRSASLHDSQAAVPLSRMTAGQVTHLYAVMDAAYCSVSLREDSRNLGHIPLIDHSPRGCEPQTRYVPINTEAQRKS